MTTAGTTAPYQLKLCHKTALSANSHTKSSAQLSALERMNVTLFGESRAQIARNKQNGQKPERMSWQEWCSPSPQQRQRRLFDHECHWYDHPKYSHGGACADGALGHNHQPRYMKWYWKSPLALVIPPLFFLWEARRLTWPGWWAHCIWQRIKAT